MTELDATALVHCQIRDQYFNINIGLCQVTHSEQHSEPFSTETFRLINFVIFLEAVFL